MCATTTTGDTKTTEFEQHQSASRRAVTARGAGLADDRLSGAAQHQEEMNAIVHFVVEALQRGGKSVEGYQFGTWANMKNDTAAAIYMMRKRVGTLFAVWSCGKNKTEGCEAQWNYAVRTATGVAFYDYLDRTSAGASAESSSALSTSATSRGAADEHTGLIVLSFQEKAAA